MTPMSKFRSLGLELPPPPQPMGVYKPALILDNMVYVSGHGTFRTDGTLIIGRVGETLTAAEAKVAARQVGLSILSTLIDQLGTLDKIERVVKVLGMVNATPDIDNHPFIINGCSELLAEIWGEEKGVGVRSAVGMGSLPDNIPVEIEAQFLLS